MLTYDVYLKKRLTEIDVIITQLVQRDSFSMYDWLNIFASIEDDLEIRKALKVESEMILDTGMDNLLEYVSEKIRNEVGDRRRYAFYGRYAKIVQIAFYFVVNHNYVGAKSHGYRADRKDRRHKPRARYTL